MSTSFTNELALEGVSSNVDSSFQTRKLTNASLKRTTMSTSFSNELALEGVSSNVDFLNRAFKKKAPRLDQGALKIPVQFIYQSHW